METYIYLHGFASSPQSAKAQALAARFGSAGVPLVIPDLNQGDFSRLTLSRQIQQVEAQLPTAAVTLIGSSLGGLTAAWIADRQPQVERLVLLAPAFEFLAHWLPRLGAEQLDRWRAEQTLPVFHYGKQQMLPLRYEFLTDAQTYDESQLRRSVPTLILHGRGDEVVPIGASQRYAHDRPWVQIVELDSDHALGDVIEEIWQAVRQFCRLP